MADYKISGERLTSIANAIRGKTGKEDSLTLEQMVTEIEGIEAGGIGVLTYTIRMNYPTV